MRQPGLVEQQFEDAFAFDLRGATEVEAVLR
jgi:hypothetical protein